MRTGFKPIERRTFGRKPLLKVGAITLNSGTGTLPCVVRDLSESGANLQVQGVAGLPEQFDLFVELDGLHASCQAIRRSTDSIAVRFLAPPSRVKSTVAGTTEASKPVQQAATMAGIEALYEAEAAARAKQRSIPIVIADDDPDDRMMIEDAFLESQFTHPFFFVENGDQLLKYLRGVAPFEGRQKPGLVLLDLNMPLMDGRTALMHIRTDRLLRSTPVVVLTTSNSEDDIQRTYELGVGGYIPKPNSVDGLLDVVSTLDRYWMRMAMPTPVPA